MLEGTSIRQSTAFSWDLQISFSRTQLNAVDLCMEAKKKALSWAKVSNMSIAQQLQIPSKT
jgi:hypothetical protein